MADNLIVCSKCGAVNRLPVARPAIDAKCGSCKNRLFSGHPEDVGGDNFTRQVEKNSRPVVVDIWAPWCGPCLAMAPAYEQATHELEPDVRLIKLNSDNEPAISSRLGIRSIPTMVMFRGGREIARTSGAMSAQQIVRWIRSQLPNAAA